MILIIYGGKITSTNDLLIFIWGNITGTNDFAHFSRKSYGPSRGEGEKKRTALQPVPVRRFNFPDWGEIEKSCSTIEQLCVQVGGEKST